MEKILMAMLVFASTFSFAQDAKDLSRSADKAYDEGAFEDAEKNYREAEKLDPNFSSSYNLGNTLYQQQKTEEATQRFRSAISKANSNEEKSRAYYNLGNTQLQGGELKDAITSYRQSLKYNPEDQDASFNYGQALAQLQQQQQQQQSQPQQGDSDEDQDQQEQDQQGQEQDQNPQDGENDAFSKDEGDEEQDQQQQGTPGEMTEEEAKKLLEIMEEQEQKTQEKLVRGNGKKKRPQKDW